MSTSHRHHETARGRRSIRTVQIPPDLELSGAILGLAPSPTLAINEAIAARRAAGRDILHLGFGEASFPLPPRLREALATAAPHTSYAPVLGTAGLRASIAAYLGRRRGLELSADEIAVAPGSKPLLFGLLQVLAGDVLLPRPSWVSYAPQARLANRRIIIVETDPADAHRLTPAALAAATARARHERADPRVLVVNSPNNPTGGMFAQDDVEALATWARREHITIVSDEIYAELAHGWRPHVSPARFYPEGTIVTGGLSKSFSAGGWRLGYAAVPHTVEGRQLISALRALASEIWSSASTPIMDAAEVAFSADPELERYVDRSARLQGHVAGRLHAALTRLGVPCPRPAGAFYLYPDFAPWRATLAGRGVHTGTDLARWLLDEWDIATLPGVAFGDVSEALRLRVATSMLVFTPGTPLAEREAQLWSLLERADTLPTEDPAAGPELPLPELERAIERLTAVVASLGTPESA
jgi:aspartate aminotransferase